MRTLLPLLPCILAALALSAALTACAPERVPPAPEEPPPVEEPPEIPEQAEPPPPQIEPEPAPTPSPEPEAVPDEPLEPPRDLLYVRTEDDLRLAFTDALYTHYRMRVNPRTPARLDADDLRAWLADLDAIAPELAARVRETVGVVLDNPNAVGFLLEDAVEAPCARFQDIVYVAVPERHQSAAARPFGGLIVRDPCLPPGDDLCLVCAGGRGDGCSCACALDACPAVRCVDC